MSEKPITDLEEAIHLVKQGSDLMPRYSMKRMRDEIHKAEERGREFERQRSASLKAMCDEMAKENERLREANRNLHRRAQIGEGLFETVKFDLEMWLTTLQTKPYYDTTIWIFSYALRHMERSIARYRKKIEDAEVRSAPYRKAQEGRP